MDNLVPNSVHPANSTFADRYPVRQRRPSDHYGIFSPAEINSKVPLMSISAQVHVNESKQ